MAAEKGHTKIVQILLKAGANINHQNKVGLITEAHHWLEMVLDAQAVYRTDFPQSNNILILYNTDWMHSSVLCSSKWSLGDSETTATSWGQGPTKQCKEISRC